MKRRKEHTVGRKRRTKRLVIAAAILLVLAIGFGVWKGARAACTVSCRAGTALPAPYSESDGVLRAVSLSFLVYGCEGCESTGGTVGALLDGAEMGILKENFGVTRTDPADPSSALLDTAEFIRAYTGDFRLLAFRSDPTSGFYGAAFCDDDAKCVWISYAGSVSVIDALACAALVCEPGLSAQEEAAFAFYDSVAESAEVCEQSYSVVLTGHSLGGALAAMVSRVSGCAAITVNGAVGLALDKINDICGGAPDVCRVSNYMTSPTNGKLSPLDLVQRLIFLGSYDGVDRRLFEANGLTDDTHCAFSFLSFADGEASLPAPSADDRPNRAESD